MGFGRKESDSFSAGLTHESCEFERNNHSEFVGGSSAVSTGFDGRKMQIARKTEKQTVSLRITFSTVIANGTF
jgi:hypothetical protein